MPFSELPRMAEVEADALQQKTPYISSDHSNEGDNVCAELVWDNGQITMQNQSSRAKRGPSPNDFPSFVSNCGVGKDAKNSKSNFDAIGSVLNDFPLSAPPCEMGLDQDDSVVPWLNFPVEVPFNNAYCPTMLHDSLGDTRSDLSRYNSSASMEKGKGYNRMTQFADASSAANGLSSMRANTSEIHQAMPRSASSELGDSDAGNASRLEIRNSAGGSTGMKLHTTDAGQPNNGSSLMNFSYISRLASTRTQRLGNENKGSDPISHNHIGSTLVNSNVCFSTQESGFHVEPSMPPSNGCRETVNPESDSVPPRGPVAVWQEPNQKSAKSLDKQFGSAPTKMVVAPEPAVATSSVCSGNGSDRASDNPTSDLKRKSCDTGDTEGPSDEVEDESVGAGKTPICAISKRSRASEVHNLSERRRRDRINEKMRALQELVPNCNRADKASMLDEAIEYLRTLQHQVQILSMGSGMCITPMMFPAALQHMHIASMPQFSPMGMGMGMGFGMGMPNVNNGMMQMSSIQSPCYPVAGPPIPSSFSYHGAAGSSQQGLGHLGQSLSMPNPHASLPFLGGFSMGLPAGDVPHMAGLANAPHSATADILRDIAQDVSSQAMFNGYANSSMNQGSNQVPILLNQQSRTAIADEAQNCIGGSGTKPS